MTPQNLLEKYSSSRPDLSVYDKVRTKTGEIGEIINLSSMGLQQTALLRNQKGESMGNWHTDSLIKIQPSK